ncbi:single-stranded DNA-binding protein [Maribacter chungangensis]|uniref:Single-stranded DNA-binding protein n=1 Tax=Maribacter chungangensis TaxID=1069117 RepID=A0ABW3B894_9FLAO
MSGTLNKVMLIGHLGDEVKMHYFEGGGSIGRFPIATNETYTNKQTGERVTNTDWHNIVVRNKAAEICEKYLSKGDKVYVEGRLKNRQWQGEDGNTRYTTEVHVQEFTFLSTKKESMANNQTQPSGNTAAPVNPPVQPKTPTGVSEPEQEDDLPF